MHKVIDFIYRILCWLDNVKPYREKLPDRYIIDRKSKTITPKL